MSAPLKALAFVVALTAWAFLLLGAHDVAHADFAGMENGTYTLNNLTFDDESNGAGMVPVDINDLPGRIVVDGDDAWLVVTVYAPNKYDALWKGLRSEAPQDPQTAEGLIEGTFVAMDDEYAANGLLRGNAYYDEETGITVKAIAFAIPLTESDLEQGSVYFVIRRSSWSPSNPGAWMGSKNHQFKFSEPVWTSDSTELIPDLVPLTPVEKAKKLIEALPADPSDITESYRAAIDKATAAYEALDDDGRAELDGTELDKEQSYGRWLESAQWGLEALQPIDNTTSLVDGDYSDVVTSSSSMGKSSSARARSWTVVKLLVKDGKATATVSCRQKSSFRSMRIGGVDYAADVDSSGVPSFTVPIELGKSLAFTLDMNAMSDSIAYRLESSVPSVAATAERVQDAAALAKKVIAQGVAAYTDATGAAVANAAQNLKLASEKQGVTFAELSAATKLLNDALAAVELKKSDSTEDSSTDDDDSTSTNTSTSTSSGTTSTSGTTSSGVTSVSRTTTPITSAATKTTTSSQSSKKSADTKKDAGGKTTKDSEASEPRLIEESTSTVQGANAPSAIDLAIAENAAKANQLSELIIAAALVGLLLVGMCLRVFLFMRGRG